MQRVVGLDGLRGVAVLVVMVFHFFPGTLPGGFIGVDIFFVISGFLITSLILLDFARYGQLRLKQFWMKRARRILPALVTVLLVCSSATLVVGGDTGLDLGAQLLGAATFSSNWVSIAAGASYFTQDAPQLFRNLWSLAVEEQFYVVWPLVVVVIAWAARPAVGAFICAALAVLSASGMAILYQSADPTRVYFGTDTHSFGLMIGAFLAFVLFRRRRNPPRAHSRVPERVATVIGVAAFGLVVVGVIAMDEVGAATYRGALLAVSALTAVLIWSIVASPRWGRMLDTAPLRAVGRRSYGLYLWHWPVLVLIAAIVGPRPEPWVSVVVGCVAGTVTFAAAWTSYALIERPFLLGDRRRTEARPLRAHRPLTVSVGIVLGAALTTATAAAVVAAPLTSQAQQSVQRGIDALDASTPPAASPTHGTPISTPSPTLTPHRPSAAPPTASPIPTIQTAPISGNEISAVGDSVMLASAGALQRALPGIAVDAEVSRQPRGAPELLSELARAGELRRVVVLGLGTNGYWGAGTLERVVEAIGPDRRLVLVTAYAPREWMTSVNDYIAKVASQHPGQVTVAPWAALAADRPDLLGPDGIHPAAGGDELYAETILKGLAGLH